MKKFNVALGLSRLSGAGKIELARNVALSMTNNPRFPNAGDMLAKLNQAITAADTALLAAADRGLKARSDLRIKLAEMEKRLQALANEVEEAANDDPENAEDIIISAGLRLRKGGVRMQSDFEVENTRTPGRVRLDARYSPRTIYKWQYLLQGNGSSWIEAGTTLQSTHFIDNLSSGSKVSFRVAQVRNKEQGPWSPVIEMVIL